MKNIMKKQRAIMTRGNIHQCGEWKNSEQNILSPPFNPIDDRKEEKDTASVGFF
jgi:hypothetical protein